ncbi:uncharacterized protein [Rutidosis leptorrhynchoides]|uniref:uncharacterized protein n=1 Tax=Rutidosis leptorrhynchoides TaxID=125765 RepID=UPI003A996ED9
MALRRSISRTLMSTAATSSSFRSSPFLPRIRPTPMSTAQSLLPLAGAPMTSHLILNVRAFCKLSQEHQMALQFKSSFIICFQADTSHVDSKTPDTSQTLNDEIKEKGADDCSVDEVSPQELYATILPKLKAKGFFDVTVDVVSSNAKFGTRTSLEDTVHSFKSVLEQRFEIPATQQCLISQGNILEDHRTLKSYGLASGYKVYLIVMGGPLKNHAAPYPTTALACPARYFQGLYYSDPEFRELLKYPKYFRQLCSGSPMTELQMIILSSGARQQQTKCRDAVKSSSSDKNRRRR